MGILKRIALFIEITQVVQKRYDEALDNVSFLVLFTYLFSYLSHHLFIQASIH